MNMPIGEICQCECHSPDADSKSFCRCWDEAGCQTCAKCQFCKQYIVIGASTDDGFSIYDPHVKRCWREWQELNDDGA